MHSKFLLVLAAAGVAMSAPGAPEKHQGDGYQGGGYQGGGYQGGGYQGGGAKAPTGYKSHGDTPTTTTAPYSAASAPAQSGPSGAASTLAYTATASDSIAAARATAKTLSPTSDVKGKVFDRIIQIYLETTAYNNSIADANCQALIKQGILLSNMYGVGAPSQPNYISPGSGDTFGLNSDSFVVVNKNVSTIVDLLEDKGISWGDYNEGLPYTGFDGFEYSNAVEGNYVRKHNLLARFESVRENSDRIAKVKNFTLFYEDVKKKELPQWVFITPNLYNNGHDTNITVSCNWTRSFVETLLKDEYVNNNTLVYVTWQANGQYGTARNHVAGFLLGSAVSSDLHGTVDDAYYNHYSEISSVEANWGLYTLGRWDVGANVWKFLAQKTGDVVRAWDSSIAHGSFESYYWNQSYGGVFSSANSTWHIYVKPNLSLVRNARSVLPSIASLWKNSDLPCYYEDIIELPDEFYPPKGFEVPVPLNPPPPITTPITIYPVTYRSDVSVTALPAKN